MRLHCLLIAVLSLHLHGCKRQSQDAAPLARQALPDEIRVESLPRDKYVLVLKSHRIRRIKDVEQELTTKAKEICAPKDVAPGKFTFETIKDLSGPDAGQSVSLFRQHIWCRYLPPEK